MGFGYAHGLCVLADLLASLETKGRAVASELPGLVPLDVVAHAWAVLALDGRYLRPDHAALSAAIGPKLMARPAAVATRPSSALDAAAASRASPARTPGALFSIPTSSPSA